MNDHIRQLFENRYRSTFSIYNENPFERTSRGVYASDSIQNVWEGFYAFYEIFKREDSVANLDLADLKIKYLLLKSENKKLVEKNKTDSLLRVMNELREALNVSANQLLGVSLAIKEHGTNISPQFFVKNFEKFSKEAKEKITKADQLLREMGINYEK